MSTIEEKIEYFNSRGHRWDEIVGNNGERRSLIASVFGRIRLEPGQRVLDAGCGNGVLFPFIEEKIGPDGELSALDAAPSMLERARSLYPDYRNITFMQGRLETAELSAEHYDVILCFSIIPHVDDIPASLANMKRALRSDGLLYIFHLSDTKSLNAFHGSLDGPVKHDMLPEREEMLLLLERAGFSVVTYLDEPGLNFMQCRA